MPHPDPELLMTHVACADPPAFRAYLARHVASCEVCALDLSALYVVAGLLLALQEPVPLGSGARERALAAARVSS